MKPMHIEQESMRIIEEQLHARGLDTRDLGAGDLGKRMIRRAIHASADFDFASILSAAPGAIDKGLTALLHSCDIVVDTKMIEAGISKPACASLGCNLRCYMADKDVAAEAERRGTTRAWVSMERALDETKDAIIVVGNAPTALLSLVKRLEAGVRPPALVIAVPVGFVQVEESKEALIKSGVPYVVSRGLKGGSTIAVSLINALLYELYKRPGA